MAIRLFRIKSPLSIVVASILISASIIGLCRLYNAINHHLWLIMIIFIILAMLILIGIYLKPLSLFKTKGVLYLDAYLLSFAIACSISGIAAVPSFKFLFVSSDKGKYAMWALFVASGIFLSLFIIRIIITKRGKTKKAQGLSIVQAYDRVFPLDEKYFTIEDKPSYRDLLGGENIIKNIYYAIKSRINDSKSVIIVNGKWGSGKTTYINLAVAKLKDELQDKLIVCDDYSAWSYEDPRSAFTALINKIYEKLNIGSSEIEVSEAIDKYVDKYLPDKPTFLGIKLLGSKINDNSIIEIINDYLDQNQKNILFIIDNIDRASFETINALFSLLADSIGINRIIFLVAYDEKYIVNMLESKKIEREYLEKVVGQSIFVPNPSKNRLEEIGKTILSNYLNRYHPNLALDKLSRTDIQIISSAFSSLNNLRELISLLNDLFNLLTIKDGRYFVDYIGINTIQSNNLDLFEFLKSNAYFIVKYYSSYLNHEGLLLSDEKNKQRDKLQKEYFEEGKQFHKYKALVSHLFPGFIDNSTPSDDFAIEVERKQRVCSGKYFANYFGYAEYGFSNLVSEIQAIMGLDDKDAFIKEFNGLFLKYSRDDLSEVLFQIENNMPGDKAKIEWAVVNLFEHYHEFYHFSKGLSSSPSDKCAQLILSLVSKMNHSKATRYLLTYKGKVHYLGLFCKLLYLNRENESDGKTKPFTKTLIRVVRSIVDKIINQKIDVYTKEYYERNMTWHLMRNSNKHLFKNYIKSIANPQNILVILNDFIKFSVSSDIERPYLLNMDISPLETYMDYKEICDLVEKASQKTEKERLMHKLFAESTHVGTAHNDNSIKLSEEPTFINNYFDE